MEGLKSKVDLLTTEVTTLGGLLQQALAGERLLVPLPQQPIIPVTNPLPPPPHPQPRQPIPLHTVQELNRTPRQPAIKQWFPKTWSDLLWAWRRRDCDSFQQADQGVWESPLRQAFCKRHYLIDHLRLTCWTARSTTLEEQEDATAASLAQSRARKTLYVVYRDLHQANAGIQRRQKRPRVEELPVHHPAQQQPAQQQPAQQPCQQQQQWQPRRRRVPQQVAAQEQIFQNWAHPEARRPVRWQPQGQGARIMAEIQPQSTEAQVRVAGAAI
jgi:hypothetical protein